MVLHLPFVCNFWDIVFVELLLVFFATTSYFKQVLGTILGIVSYLTSSLSWSARDLGSNDSLNKLVEESAVMGGLTPTLTLILTLIEGECCDGWSDRCHR